ncbi:uncharacterized protein LOC136752548 isoform X2 [Amia ocellicauda]|uniref:uncharacterized protein LOC136752548 isoform X2 n=1 Tax=Amia ocellicauda TaxID=2972642 RepID=UPI003464B3CF
MACAKGYAALQEQASTSSAWPELAEGSGVKEEQMELACDQSNPAVGVEGVEASLAGGAVRSTSQTHSCSAVAGCEEGTLACETQSEQGRGNPEKQVLAAAAPSVKQTSCVSVLVASDVTELGSVHIIEDVYLAAAIKEEMTEETFLRPAAEPGEACCGRPADAVDGSSERWRGPSDFETLKAQLLSAKPCVADDGSVGARMGCAGTEWASKDCKVCGRSFSHRETLRLHQLLHKLDDMYDCAVCGKSLVVRAHRSQACISGQGQGQGQHQCADCGKNFSHPKSLSRHRRIHKAEPMYGCS